MRNDAHRALDENHFSPLITQLSPRSSAWVVKTLGSAPPCGSVIEKHETISFLSSGSRYCFFCSGVPYLARISALPESGAWHPKTVGAKRERPRISFISASFTCP